MWGRAEDPSQVSSFWDRAGGGAKVGIQEEEQDWPSPLSGPHGTPFPSWKSNIKIPMGLNLFSWKHYLFLQPFSLVSSAQAPRSETEACLPVRSKQPWVVYSIAKLPHSRLHLSGSPLELPFTALLTCQLKKQPIFCSCSASKPHLPLLYLCHWIFLPKCSSLHLSLINFKPVDLVHLYSLWKMLSSPDS